MKTSIHHLVCFFFFSSSPRPAGPLSQCDSKELEIPDHCQQAQSKSFVYSHSEHRQQVATHGSMHPSVLFVAVVAISAPPRCMAAAPPVALRSPRRRRWHSGRTRFWEEVLTGRVYLIDKLKISEVSDKREYRIYRNSIGDREIFSDKI